MPRTVKGFVKNLCQACNEREANVFTSAYRVTNPNGGAELLLAMCGQCYDAAIEAANKKEATP